MSSLLYVYPNSNNALLTWRRESLNGKDYIVAQGVPLVEGVLNGRFVSAEEFGAFVNDWNGVPVVMRHPQENGGSARVPEPDVPVVGKFYGAKLDGKRLVGEYWLEADKLDTPEGEIILSSLSTQKPSETSTGYWAESVPAEGNWNGRDFAFIDQNIHPDHIALLPDEIGACSLQDGCGMNRNSKDGDMNQNAVTKTEAWGEETAGSYLVVGDPEKVTTWHLPIKKGGKLDRGLAGRAWSELFSGGRTGKGYQGPDKEKAKAKLRKIYEDNQWPIPSEKQNAAMTNATLDGSLEQRMNEVYDAFMSKYRGSNTAVPMSSEAPYIISTFDSYLVVKADAKFYQVNYSRTGDGIVFDPREKWQEVLRVEKYVPIQNVSGLTGRAAKVWEDVYQSYIDKKMSPEDAAKRAWAAIKQGWEKDKDGNWVKKNQLNSLDITPQELEGLASLAAFVAN